ncbi:hypothetical protein HanPI659440_Chr05g0193381 [Helianthus annuus]|nr:hypothetical protein HanPI659440_Chr05g0193381 [Helianthus annuus]
MENNTPSSSAPPISAGTGGKFRKPPVSRNRPSTPYDRPPSLPTASYKSNDDDGGGWLSKLVVTPARRFIASSATRILPALFSKSEPSVADEYDYDSSDLNRPTNRMLCLYSYVHLCSWAGGACSFL